MTMLDRMRRHKSWLKWSLGIVVLAFVLLYVPSFLQTNGPQATDTIATVDGRDVKAGDFRILYQQQVDAYRQAYGAQVNMMIDGGAWADPDELAEAFETHKGYAYGRSGAPMKQRA